MVRFFIFNISISAFFSVAFVGKAIAQPAEDSSTLRAIWRPTYRPTWIYYEDTDATTTDVLFSREEGGLKQEGVEPYRFELEWKSKKSRQMRWLARFIGGATTLKLAEEFSPADGFDGWLDLGGSFDSEVAWADDFETIAAIRVYYATYDEDEVPDRGNLGLTVGIRPTWGNFSLLLEATTEAISLFTPNRMGEQQDASAFRMRGERVFLLKQNGWSFLTGLDLFHSKADYTSTKVVPGHEAVFWDDVQLSLLLGIQAKM